jgi:REP element-mobilizing transposase RayT
MDTPPFINFIKGKSAIQIARNFVGRKKNFTGQHFWARGYHVSTVGRDEKVIRKYIIMSRKKKIAESISSIFLTSRLPVTFRWHIV